MQQKHVDERRQEDEQKPNTEQLREHTQAVVEGAQREVAAAHIPWYRTLKRGQILLVLYALQVALFAALAWWVHYHPVLPIDVAITREFQENQSPWLKFTMIAVSYIGSVLLLSAGLVLLAAAILWLVRLRLEAVMLVATCATSTLLNGLIKLIVARPRPNAQLVEVIQAASGNSFPSGHVMQYVAFWGFLFSLGIILFEGKPWWRVATNGASSCRCRAMWRRSAIRACCTRSSRAPRRRLQSPWCNGPARLCRSRCCRGP